MPEEHRSELRLAPQLQFSTASGVCRDCDILPKKELHRRLWESMVYGLTSFDPTL